MEDHVGIEWKVCPVCGVEHETNTIIMATKFKRNRNGEMEPIQKLKKKTVTGYGFCNEHQKLFDEGYIACIAVDLERSDVQKNGNIKIEDAFRTGELIHMKEDAFRKAFQVEPPEGKVALMPQSVVKQLIEMAGN